MLENRDLLCLAVDGSGSFCKTKKQCLMYRLGKHYGIGLVDYADTSYISFTTVAKKQESLRDLIYSSENGGTYISSCLEKSLDIIKYKYDIKEHDGTSKYIDIIVATDGDNWCEDNDRTIEYLERLIKLGENVNIHIWEIKTSSYVSTILDKIENHFKDGHPQIRIEKPYDEYTQYKKLFCKSDNN